MNLKSQRMAIFCSIALSACSVNIETDDAEETVDEDVGTAPAALGDLLCASSNNTDRIVQNVAWAVGTTYSYTTPDGTYGSDITSGEDCNSAFNTHFEGGLTGDIAMSVQYSVAWGDTAINNQTDCERAHLSIAAYYFDHPNGDTWHYVSGMDVTGTWSGSSCTFPSTNVNKSFSCFPPDGCQGFPVVSGRAYLSNPFAPPTHKKVTTRIKRTS